MADIEDRDIHCIAQALEIGQDLGLARLVERRERLVGEDQLRRGEQRTPDRHALLLTTRERSRAALEEMVDAEQIDHLPEKSSRFASRGANQRP